jgi:hypothetical protein
VLRTHKLGRNRFSADRIITLLTRVAG